MKGLRNWIHIILLLSAVSANAQNTRPAAWADKVVGVSLRNSYKLSDSVYRSAQPRKKDKAEFSKLQITAVLNLRSSHADAATLFPAGTIAYRVKMKARDIREEEVVAALRIIRASPKPLLIHCRYGADRTGLIMAMYRIIFQNWTKDEAIDELLHGGYGFHRKYANIPAYIKAADMEDIKKLVLGTK